MITVLIAVLAVVATGIALLVHGGSSNSGVQGSGAAVTQTRVGQAQLSQLAARDVHAVVTGSGLIRVTAAASVDAAVPGTGAIIYAGNPSRVSTSVTGTGTVTRG